MTRSVEQYKEYRTKVGYTSVDVSEVMANSGLNISDGVHFLCEYLSKVAIEEGRPKDLLLQQLSKVYDWMEKQPV
jgi:hypothetical protein